MGTKQLDMVRSLKLSLGYLWFNMGTKLKTYDTSKDKVLDTYDLTWVQNNLRCMSSSSSVLDIYGLTWVQK